MSANVVNVLRNQADSRARVFQVGRSQNPSSRKAIRKIESPSIILKQWPGLVMNLLTSDMERPSRNRSRDAQLERLDSRPITKN